MKLFRMLGLCAIVAAAGYLAADDGGGTMGTGNRDGGFAGPGTRAGDGVDVTSSEDGGGFFGGGTMGSGGKDDGGGIMGTGTLTEYVDENGGRFLIVSFDDGSWFVLGIQ